MNALPGFSPGGGLGPLVLTAAVVAVGTPGIGWAAPPTPSVPADVPPRVASRLPGVRLDLLHEHPAIVTPTGIDVDDQGRVWVVACHTHFRPEDYQGPEHDEVLVLAPDGSRSLFASSTQKTMNLLLGKDGFVYLAERSRILRLRDSDGDGRADEELVIATLATETDYPHNGLAGLAWHPEGDLLFSLGENFGKPWMLSGQDGNTLQGRGEGGVFRCSPVGRGLRRVARGFWNPFGVTVRSNGEIFAVDNDPGSRPPCRLLHVVDGADYGFQWVYGSSPVHPFVSWNGELRGTLGMITGSGEGPCAVAELGGGLLVPSWSQHRIDYFALTRAGAGYEASRHELVSGGEHFRPTCMARGPDGSFYLADWVYSSYAVHRRGRIWKLAIDPAAATWLAPDWPAETEASRLAERLRREAPEAIVALPATGQQLTRSQLMELVRGADAELADAALSQIARLARAAGPSSLAALSKEDLLWTIVALRRCCLDDPRWVRAVWPTARGALRWECLRWIADAVFLEFAAEVNELLKDAKLDYRTFEAALATANTLRGRPEAGVTDATVLLDRLADPAAAPRAKGFIVRLLPADQLSMPLIEQLLAVDDLDLTREVVRTLAASAAAEAVPVLASIARDASRPVGLRCDAIAGLAASDRPVDRQLLAALARGSHPQLAAEASRSLRDQASSPAPPSRRPHGSDTAAWQADLDRVTEPVDIESGRRLFFHSRLGRCSTCHRHLGRGRVVGPDLSLIGRQTDREGLLRSILEPGRDVSPQYRAHTVVLADGTTFTGMLLRSSSTEVYRGLDGMERTFRPEEIETVAELHGSVMPDGLVSSLTPRELRDLIAFLEASR
jgi:putative membrane-bound dehydrogenase-like protein